MEGRKRELEPDHPTHEANGDPAPNRQVHLSAPTDPRVKSSAEDIRRSQSSGLSGYSSRGTSGSAEVDPKLQVTSLLRQFRSWGSGEGGPPQLLEGEDERRGTPSNAQAAIDLSSLRSVSTWPTATAGHPEDGHEVQPHHLPPFPTSPHRGFGVSAGPPPVPSLISAFPLQALASLSTSSPLLPSLHELSAFAAPPSDISSVTARGMSPPSRHSSPPRTDDEATSEFKGKRKRSDDRKSEPAGETRQERHNIAEQKRRNQMRKGFDHLQSLLPQGGDKKMTKVTLIAETIDYITQLQSTSYKLLAENAQLREELRYFQAQFSFARTQPYPFLADPRVQIADYPPHQAQHQSLQTIQAPPTLPMMQARSSYLPATPQYAPYARPYLNLSIPIPSHPGHGGPPAPPSDTLY